MKPRTLAALGLVVVGLATAPVLAPGTVISARDIPTFHLPLRAWFWQEAAELGRLPEWNPGIHHGQPTLSNPNTMAFYPPSWLGLVLAPERALGWLVWLHVLWGAAGLMRLSRLLGASVGASVVAGIGFGLGAPFLSLINALPVLFSTAWLPWVLFFGLRAIGPERGSVFVAACALALQFLAGEPVLPMLSGLGLGLLVLLGPTPPAVRGRALLRLAAIGAFAAALAAVQLVPTTVRVLESPRAGGADEEQALRWSLPPERLLELILPTFHGHPHRDESGELFGWELHDRNFPYVPYLAPAGALWVLAVAGAFGAGRWRRPLLGIGIVGVAMALGRHDPLYLLLRELPPFGWVRYPEKWLLLAITLAFVAAAIGLDRWRAGGFRLPLGAAAILTVAAGSWWGWLGSNAALEWISVRGGGGPPQVILEQQRWLRGEAFATAAIAGLVALLLWWGREPERRRAASLALAGLAIVPLVPAVGSLLFTIPAPLFLTAPPTLDAVAPGARILNTMTYDGEEDVGVRVGPVGAQQAIGRVRRLDPYCALLFGRRYGFHRDYDLMMTPWAVYAHEMFLDQWHTDSSRRSAVALARAWSTEAVVWRRSMAELAEEARATRRAPELVRVEVDPAPVPVVRAVSRVEVHSDQTQAQDTAVAASWDPATTWISTPQPTNDFELPTHLEASDGSDEMALEWTSTAPVAVVIARTFDPRWKAMLADGTALDLHPNALGQVFVTLPPAPAGGRATLRFRDPTVPIGLLLSALALLAGGVSTVIARRRGVSA
jgi:hypothetical protein